jgi:hypothetical protein
MTAVMVDAPPRTKTRYETLKALQHELGNTEQTAILLEDLQDAWHTVDQLIGRFGLERATELVVCESQEQATHAYLEED